jgi:hypothetical protein
MSHSVSSKVDGIIKRLTSKKARQNWILQKTIQRILDMDDITGLLAKVALFGGLEREEVFTLYRKQICTHDPSYCDCNSLHTVTNSFDLVFVSIRGCYPKDRAFTILPDILWQRFRGLEMLSEGDIALTETATKIGGTRFCELAILWTEIVQNTPELFAQSMHDPNSFNSSRIQVLFNDYRNAWNQFLSY